MPFIKITYTLKTIDDELNGVKDLEVPDISAAAIHNAILDYVDEIKNKVTLTVKYFKSSPSTEEHNALLKITDDLSRVYKS